MKLSKNPSGLRKSITCVLCSLVLTFSLTPAAFAGTKAGETSTSVTAEDILTGTEDDMSSQQSISSKKDIDVDMPVSFEVIDLSEDIAVQSCNFSLAKKKTYTVKYVAVDTTKGKSFSTTYNLGAAMKLPSPGWTRTGYYLFGWSTTKNGISKFGPGTRVPSGLGKKAGETIYLYPNWYPSKYKIIYKANGGKGAPSSGDYYTDCKTKLSSVKPTRRGYTFLGWSEYPDDDASGLRPGSTVYFNSGRNVTLYAIWRK